MKSLTLSRKITLGFALLLLLTGLLGGLAVSSMRIVQRTTQVLATEFVPEVAVSGALQRHLDDAQLAIRSYGFTAEPAYLAEARQHLAAVQADLTQAQKLADAHPNLVKLRQEIGPLRTLLQSYEAAVETTVARNGEITASRHKLDEAAAVFIGNLDHLIEQQKTRLQNEIKAGEPAAALATRVQKLNLAQDIRSLGNAARIGAFKAQALREPALFQDSLKNFEPMEQRFTELFGLLKVQSDIEQLNQAKRAAGDYRDAVRVVLDGSVALAETGKKRAAVAQEIIDLSAAMATAGMQRTIDAANSSNSRLAVSATTILIGLGLALAVGGIVAFLISRGTTKVLSFVSAGLSESAQHVAAAAGQVAAASQSLAEGSTEQAASLEETSASLEEMASMTKRNAESANQAKDLSNLTRTSADTGATHMGEMRQAMDAIKSSSDDIAKIIKTIDEIAFQTNILALNAAVEAARAGEAGMGFAVVAEEVRNLAQRSALSAKETAEKIEDAIRKSEHGVVVSGRVAEALTDIVEKARRVDLLVAEIASASSEQSQGIGQLNKAVSQMDRVTQSNAGNAEESAAAAEELNAQAAAMQEAVAHLRHLFVPAGTAATAAPAVATPPPARTPKVVSPAVRRQQPVPLDFGGDETPGVNGHERYARR